MVNVGSVNQVGSIPVELIQQGVFPVDLTPVKPSGDKTIPNNYNYPPLPLQDDNSPDNYNKAEESNQPFDKEQMKKVLDVVNNVMKGLNVRLEFGLYGETDQFFVKIIDRGVNRVVRVMPPAELLELKEKIGKAVGMILDEKV